MYARACMCVFSLRVCVWLWCVGFLLACFFVCLFVCLSGLFVCLFVCLFVSVCVCVRLFVCLLRFGVVWFVCLFVCLFVCVLFCLGCVSFVLLSCLCVAAAVVAIVAVVVLVVWICLWLSCRPKVRTLSPHDLGSVSSMCDMFSQFVLPTVNGRLPIMLNRAQSFTQQRRRVLSCPWVNVLRLMIRSLVVTRMSMCELMLQTFRGLTRAARC